MDILGLKMKKINKNKFTFAICLIFLMIIMLNLSSAGIEFFQTTEDTGNFTLRNHIFLSYSKSGMAISQDTMHEDCDEWWCIIYQFFVSYSKGGMVVVNDYVSGDNPYEIYFLYSFYPRTWNELNPYNQVNYCEFIVRHLTHLSGEPQTIYAINYTGQNADVSNAKYFVRLNDGDGVVSDISCHFQNATSETSAINSLDMPATIQVVTPTWECKMCQFYEWSLVERDILKAQTIGGNVVIVSEYIKKLIALNFEILLALFWFFMIMMIFVAIGFIFLICYYFYLFLKNIIK
jgi:hypothetical protein